jgi:myosin heavy subunit
MLNENLISTLEQSLRQTRNAQNRLLGRLREVETEAESLRQEIQAMENSAAQTEAAIYSLLATMGSNKQAWNVKQIPQKYEEDDYELQREINRRPPRSTNQNNQPNNYRNNSVAYINQNRNVPSIAPHIEPVSHRFADRTITQACTLLLREANEPLHVHELYNLLVAGGFEFTGNNPTISIAVSLNRNRRFRKVAPGTFDLVMRDASQAAS